MMGEWKFYREIRIVANWNFEDNMKHGKWIRYNREGQIEYEEEFINNVVKKKSNTLL